MTHTSTWWCVSHTNCSHHVQRSESAARVEAYDPANSTSAILDDVDKGYVGNRSSPASSTLTSYLLCITLRNTFVHVLVTYPESSRGLNSDINNFGPEIRVHHASTCTFPFMCTLYMPNPAESCVYLYDTLSSPFFLNLNTSDWIHIGLQRDCPNLRFCSKRERF